MGADMLAATLVVKVDTKLDWDAGHAAVEKVDFTKVDENVLYDLDDVTYEEEENFNFAPSLHKIIDAVKESHDGRCVTYHTYGDVGIFISGGLSGGDVDDETQAMWTLSEFPEVLEAIGFVTKGLTVKEDA